MTKAQYIAYLKKQYQEAIQERNKFDCGFDAVSYARKEYMRGKVDALYYALRMAEVLTPESMSEHISRQLTKPVLVIPLESEEWPW